MKILAKRTNLPEFQLDDLALRDRRTTLLEFDRDRRSLARDRSLDQNLRNTARNLGDYVTDRLYMCEQARRYVGLVRRRDEPLGEPLRVTKLHRGPGAVRHIWQRFLSFDGKWAVHSNIRRWRRRIRKIQREAATVNRMLDRLRIEIDPVVRPEACLLPNCGTNVMAQTPPQTPTASSGNSTSDALTSVDASIGAITMTRSSVGSISPADSEGHSAEVSTQADARLDKELAVIAAHPAEPAIGITHGIPRSDQAELCPAEAQEQSDLALAASLETAVRTEVNATYAAANRDCENASGSDPDPKIDPQCVGPQDRTDRPHTQDIVAADGVQMPRINFPPIQIVIENHQIADRALYRGAASEAGREVESNNEKSALKWDFELNLNNLPEEIEIGGETYQRHDSASPRYYTQCDRATDKQKICAVLHEVYEVPIVVITERLGLKSHKSVQDLIDDCKKNIDAEDSKQNRRKKRAKHGMDGDWPN